jgi:pimeloyl-ACP methyl ester carboxylesterase
LNRAVAKILLEGKIMKSSIKRLAIATAIAAIALSVAACSNVPTISAAPKAEISEIKVNPDITLRQMVYRPAHAKGTVLFLHGFPETMYAWKPVAESLSGEYEVHAFDWPGYGQSSRPSADRFAYAPIDYAHVLEDYIKASGIDRSKLVIYATDIGALPPLLAALEQPDIAKEIIVGDFAPFNRPQYMYETLQGLKSKLSSDVVHAAMNKGRHEILSNTFFRGLPTEQRYSIPQDLRDDMAKGWGGEITSADAFYHYYSHFTRDQDYFETHMSKLKVPVKVVWGEKDIYIKKEMGSEFAERANVKLTILHGLGHYPHLQAPKQTADEIRVEMNSGNSPTGY